MKNFNISLLNNDFTFVKESLKYIYKGEEHLILNGLNLTCDGSNDVEAYACDGFKLINFKLNFANLNKESFNVIVPIEAIKDISKFKISDKANIVISNDIVTIYKNGTPRKEYYLLGGKYPNCKAIIAKKEYLKEIDLKPNKIMIDYLSGIVKMGFGSVCVHVVDGDIVIDALRADEYKTICRFNTGVDSWNFTPVEYNALNLLTSLKTMLKMGGVFQIGDGWRTSKINGFEYSITFAELECDTDLINRLNIEF